jgi:hypothetical protein
MIRTFDRFNLLAMTSKLASTVRQLVLCAGLLMMACNAYAVMYGYATHPTGLYRVNTQTAAITAMYTNAAPFDGATTVAAAAVRPSDGMLFFLFNSTANQRVYRWDPANPTTAPVLLGQTGAAVPYVLRLGFHPTNGLLYGNDANPSTTLWTINQTTGAASVATTISGIPAGTSGDMAFHPTTGELYSVITTAAGIATVYRIPLGGGAVTNEGTVTGLPAAALINSAMFNASGVLFIGGSGTLNLWTVPLTGGPATTIGGAFPGNPQDFASAPSPSPTLSKSFSPAAVAPNSSSTLTITLSNTYANPQRGAAFTDTYPAGLVNSPVPGVSTTCGGTVTATAGGGSVALSGGTIPANGSCTVSVSVRSAAVGTFNNSIAIEGLTTIFAFNDSVANATLVVTLLPSLTHLKTVSVTSDPFNGSTNPKNIPGAEMLYTLRVTNSGLGTVANDTFVITDPLPANIDLFVGDLGAVGSGPIAFTSSTTTATSTASGLSFTFTSLASVSDDIGFFTDAACTTAVTPTPPYDASVRCIRLNPKGTMAAAAAGNSFVELRFRVRLK